MMNPGRLGTLVNLYGTVRISWETSQNCPQIYAFLLFLPFRLLKILVGVDMIQSGNNASNQHCFGEGASLRLRSIDCIPE